MQTRLANEKDMLEQIEQGKHIYFDWKIKLLFTMRRHFLATDRCDLALGMKDLIY